MQKFHDMHYERPNFDEAKKNYLELQSICETANSYGELRAAYMDCGKKQQRFDTLCVIASIRNTMDTTDEFYEKEVEYIDEQMPLLQLALKECNQALINSPFLADFEKEFGSVIIQGIRAQIRLSDESIVPLKVEESKISQEYSKVTAGATCEFMGEQCNFYGLLKHMLSTDRQERKEAFVAWSNLYQTIADQLNNFYDRLVELRVEMAERLGFENYIEMAYLQNGHYDYTIGDVANFRRQVVEEVVPAVQKIHEKQAERLGVEKIYYYDEELCYPDGNAVPEGDKDEMLKAAQKMYRELSKETGEFFDFMMQYDLFDLETKPGKHMGGYCTFLPQYKAPFIFSNFNGTSADVDVLTHEAGHAFQAYTSSRHVALDEQVWSTSEISEIHSMTMEHFTYGWMELFFHDNAEKYRSAHLASAISIVPYLCMVDHFQQEVYSDPKMTAQERYECWHRLEELYMPWRNYDGDEFMGNGAFWMQKQHIFLYPFYYVDYALAQMGAFEYFTKSLHDFKGAWEDYYNLCKAGGSLPYFELLKVGNLSNPFENGTVKNAISGVLEELKKKNM